MVLWSASKDDYATLEELVELEQPHAPREGHVVVKSPLRCFKIVGNVHLKPTFGSRIGASPGVISHNFEVKFDVESGIHRLMFEPILI